MSEDVDTSPKQSDFGFLSRNGSKLRGGLPVILLSLGLFVGTFYITSPTVPRIISIALILVGVAVAAGLCGCALRRISMAGWSSSWWHVWP